MRFFNFDQFKLNEEKHGVSFASIIFSELLEKRAMEKFLDFLESNENSLTVQDNIKWWRLQNFIKNQPQEVKENIWKLYPEFPVVGFELQLVFKKMTPKSFDSRYERSTNSNFGAPLAGGGFASSFGHKNWKNYSKIVEPIRKIADVGLIIQLGVELDIDKVNFNLSNPEHKRELDEIVGSTIYHELNHCFEHYKRVTRVTKRDEIRKPVYDRSFNTSITYAENNRWKFAKPIWKIWSDKFLYYTYISEKHELNAIVQEMYYYVKKYPEKDLTSFRIWKIADKMEKFDSVEFYSELINEIKKHNWKDISGNFYLSGLRDAEQIADKLKEMWVSVYKREVEEQKATPMVSFSVLEKMSCMEFIVYWQKRFNDNGKYLKRKIGAIKYEEILKNK